MTDYPTNVDATSAAGVEPSAAKRALLVIRDLRAQLSALRSETKSPVAIVGMSCRFPGAPSLDSFWEMLCERRDGVREVPADRWDAARFFHPDHKTAGKIAGRWGGFLDEVDRFDAAFFGISPREAPHVDPRQRKMLEIAWEALEDAGIPPPSLGGTDTGVYLATLSNDYDIMLCQNYRSFTASTGTGTANSIIANRLSYFLNLAGPSLTLDTACSGSLLAIDFACRSLRAGESSLAIAGGVSINLLPKGDVFFSRAGALSPTGRCKTFDSDADGIVRSEGAGVVILKRLSDAIEDGDRIYAVIRGGAVNHDGSSNGIMAPNGRAQQRVLREAYKNAGISPGAAQYVEAHGTGTPLGDPIEVEALTAVMAEGRNGTRLVLGSVKTNVGHMEAAAGVASVIKVALALHHGAIPPNREFNEWNPRIAQPGFAMEVARDMVAWPRTDKPRIAGVSGFSFGGTNAHLVLEEAPDATLSGVPSTDGGTFVLPISAKSPEALRESIDSHREFLASGAGGAALGDACYSAALRRAHHNHRYAVTGSTVAEMVSQLSPGTDKPATPEVTKLAFVFSGQGSHWQHMGEDLSRTEPVFREVMEKCDRLFAQQTGWSVLDEIHSGARLNETDVSQAAIFSMQVALAALWRSWGIRPHAVVGQSLGEVAAAHIAGALSLESAVAVVYHRSRVMKSVSGQGKTAVVGLTASATRELIAEWDGLYVAGVTSPKTSVVSGTPGAVEAMLSALAQRDVFARAINGVNVAFHSPHMEPLRDDLENSLDGIECAPAQIGMMSTITGQWLNGAKPDARYWGRNLCEPFQLAGALAQLIDEGVDGFLEISPSALLGGSIRQAVADKDSSALVLSSSQNGEPARERMLASLSSLYAARCDVNWPALFPEGGRCVSLPTYPWQRERYWIDQLPGGSAAARKSAQGHPLLGEATVSALPGGQRFWEQDLDLHSLSYLSGHRVLGSAVFPGAGYLEAALAAVRELNRGSGCVEVTGLRFYEPMPLSEDGARRVQLAFSPNAGGGYDFQFSARELSADSWTRHAGGAARGTERLAEDFKLTELRERCREQIAAEAHYQAMAAQGLDYGENFRAIRQVWRRQAEAFAELELDATATADVSDYGVHPILLDAALQVVAATIDPSEGQTYSNESYLPHGVGRARFYQSPGNRAVCVARLKSGQAGDAELRADLLLVDSDGRVCLEIEDLTLVHVGAAQSGARGKLHDWLYDLCWEETPRSSTARSATTGAWTIFTDAHGLGEQLADLMRESGCACVVVSPGDDDLEKHIAAAGTGIAYLRGLDDQEDPCRFLLRLVTGMAQSGKRELPALWIVTRETQAVDGCGTRLSPAAQLWGFGKVVALEHPELRGGLVDLGGPAADEAQQLCDELLAPDDERQLAFRNGARFVARIKPSAVTTAPGPVVFRADATYLITGGLGGLGLAVARWMTERGARRFILTGRSRLPARSEWPSLAATDPAKLKVEGLLELERLGATVYAPEVDVSDADKVAAMVDAFHAEGWPRIRGVIHAAGIINDQLMLRLDWETFAQVMRPKVAGARAMHEATKDLDLDFFTLFSSLSSVLGQFGQAHYAAGNSFMDSLAHWRRGQGLPANTINWGPWAEVGLYARSDATDKTGRSGVFPMLPDQALAAMEQIHALAPTQAIVVSADWSRMPPSPLLAGVAPEGAGVVRSAEDEQAAAALLLDLLLAEPDERKQRLQEYLGGAVAVVLGLDPSRLDYTEPLTSLGMDSIMVVELKNQIEKTMNLNISMVDLFMGSVVKLAEQLSDKLADSRQLEELLTQVESMSPEEIKALLGE